MAKALLLTGEKKVGKTTALRSIVTSLGEEHFVGFYATERRQDGRRVGFGVAMLDGREGTLADIDSDSTMRVGRVIDGRIKYGVELGFLEDVAVPAVRSALDHRTDQVVLIDEIGPMQLYSHAFRHLVLDALASSSIILGSVMSPSDPWVDALKSRNDVETFLLTFQNRDSMTEMMTLYLGTKIGAPAMPVTNP
ncbi:MAG TPA: nucleoside-triphosphatase [Streptosporangiaceae bacterium]|nr:nucleoside-triphosphatase [Streptosporangiaceae bacterium]